MSLVERFRRHTSDNPHRRLFTFVDANGRDTASLTFGEVDAQASAVAAYLRDRARLRPGDRVVLVYPPSLEFIPALLGCMMAGVVPVPVYPPDPFKLHHDVTGFRKLVADCDAKGILTNGKFNVLRQAAGLKDALLRTGTDWPDLPWHATDGLAPARAPFAPVAVRPDDVAFLQYTSGSTSTPKGVMITHGNIVAEVEDNQRALGLGLDATAVIWVPQYHDLGLICCLMSGLAGNGHVYLISPMSFVQRPAVWFEVMSRVRATHTCSPNFGFALGVRKTTPEQRAKWDLSSIKVVLSGAEPIRQDNIDRFYREFAASGLRPGTFVPAYGLAEHTVSVALAPRGYRRFDRAALAGGRAKASDATGADEGLALFSYGPIVKPESRVRIVDPESSRAVPDGAVGEIWVDSPTKAAGYHGRAEESERTFRARVAGDDDPRRYLRTGDLGFFHEGELFVTGRIKDVVIVRGRNHYPQDIEESAQAAHPLVRPGGVAAFSFHDHEGAEGVGLLVDVREQNLSAAQASEVAAAVGEHVKRNHQLQCVAIGVGVPGTVLKTTSGKLRRGACRDALRGAGPRSLLALQHAQAAV